MRLRKKWWARPEMETSSIIITKPHEYKGIWSSEFKNGNDIYLELGCGRGTFIADQANQNKNINFIGIDLKDEVIVFALRKVIENELENVRLIPMNIMQVEEIFSENEISRIYINFCNPWPKLRHNKRRLTHTKFLSMYKKFIKPGSEIWFKTDNAELFSDSCDYFKESGMEIVYSTEDLHSSNFDMNVMTEYETKFYNMGNKIMFLIAKYK
jgi:tRNA (guanine-N7-)-methyltransferase